MEYLIKLVKDSINTSKYHELQTTSDRLAYLRALAINTLITEAAEIFLKNEDAILEGEFHEALFDKSKYEAQIRDIIKISVEKIYQSEEVIGKEIAGFKMLSYLLDIYTQAFLADTENEDSNFTKLVKKSVPQLSYLNEEDSIYDKLIAICSYIASLTDGLTVASFKRFQGLDA